jgi:hypothetical protein
VSFKNQIVVVSLIDYYSFYHTLLNLTHIELAPVCLLDLEKKKYDECFRHESIFPLYNTHEMISIGFHHQYINLALLLNRNMQRLISNRVIKYAH